MDSENIISSRKPYDKAFMGGTFDRFHEAHRCMIHTAVSMAETVFIGVVSESLGKKLFTKKIYGDQIQKYDIRYANVMNFTTSISNKCEIAPLTDPWGPAPFASVHNGAIIVSNETLGSGEKINNIREKNGLIPLDIIVIPWVRDSIGENLSSTRLRIKEFGSP